jgi:hypothetical protein
MYTTRFQRSTACAIVALMLSMASAAGASPVSAQGPIHAELRQREALAGSRPVHVKSWLSPAARRRATATSQLIYASVITSLSTGQTNIYTKQNGTLALVGQLNEGGGPIAVDSQGNVYVAEAGSNVLGYVPRNVYVYAPGATTPTRVLQNPNYMSWSIAVAKDGTVFVAGPSVTENASGEYVGGIMKYAAGATTGTLLAADPIVPWESSGLAADSNDNLFVGWTTTHGTGIAHCSVGPLTGCAREQRSGSSSWKAWIPFGSAANGITTGPILGSNSSKTITVIASGIVQYMMTFPNGSDVPSQVTPIPLGSVPIYELCFDSSGYSVWAGNTLFNSPVAYTIWQLDYPTGTVRLAYQIPQSSGIAIPADNGIAVSPAYYPN